MDIIGHAFFLENAVEVGNRFIGNLGMLVRSGFVLPTDSQPTVFWITNPNNTFIRNVASGSDNTCFWYLGNFIPLNEEALSPVKPYQAPWGIFRDNVAHTCRVGLRFDEGIDSVTGELIDGKIDPLNQSGRTPIAIQGILVHHCYNMGLWIRTSINGDFICQNCIVSDSKLAHRLAFHQQLKDSLVVGISENYKCSMKYNWPPNGTATSVAGCSLNSSLDLITGFAIYDGPSELDRVHFAGFYGRLSPLKSYAFMNFGASLKSTAHIAKRISFDRNMNPSAIADLIGVPVCSVWSSQLIDEDGSITGVRNSYIIPEIVTPQEATNVASRGFIPAELRSMPIQWDKGFNLPPIGSRANCTKFLLYVLLLMPHVSITLGLMD